MFSFNEEKVMRKEGRINWALPAAMAAAALVVGCGGGGVNGVAVTGKVMDGYLTGAQICLDVNNNKSCDANEPTTTSGAGGVFSLNPPSNLDLTTVRLIANVPATAVDEDNPLVPVGTAYQLTAPANVTVVTPLTTLAMSYKDNGQSWAQAVESVKTNLGISDPDFKVDTDYVAEANIKTHNVARLVAGVIQTNQIQGSANIRSIVVGISSFANNAFNSSTALLSSELSNLVNNGAYAVRQVTFASSYTPDPAWVGELSVFKQGGTDTDGIYGWGVAPDTNIWGETWSGAAGSESANGPNFYWGSWSGALAGLDYFESWVMRPNGLNISGMTKLNIKVWGNPEIAGAQRFTPVIEARAIDNCVPTAVSNRVLEAAALSSGTLNNQSDARFQLDLNTFVITQSCGGTVSTISEFIKRDLVTVRVRIYKANSHSVMGINLGAISFEP